MGCSCLVFGHVLAARGGSTWSVNLRIYHLKSFDPLLLIGFGIKYSFLYTADAFLFVILGPQSQGLMLRVIVMCRELGSCGVSSNNLHSCTCPAEPPIRIRILGVDWGLAVLAGRCFSYVLRLHLVVPRAREGGFFRTPLPPLPWPCIPHSRSVLFRLLAPTNGLGCMEFGS